MTKYNKRNHSNELPIKVANKILSDIFGENFVKSMHKVDIEEKYEKRNG